LKDEIRLYYGGSDYLHFGWRNGSLNLATLRPDGFAGYEQELGGRPAVVATRAISYNGQNIYISADVTPGGSVKVTATDSNGKEIAGAELVTLTVTDGQLNLDTKIEADQLSLKFELEKAKLYSFSFGE